MVIRRIVVGTIALVVLATSAGFAGAPAGAQSPEPPTPRASAEASFAIELADPGPFAPGEAVTVTYTGARPLASIQVNLCDQTGSACRSSGYATAGSSGSGTLEVVMRRRLARAPGFVDCATEPCALVGNMYGTELEATSVLPVAIDPAAPMPRPTLAIVEPGPLAARPTVTVEGSGFDGVTFISFYECSWDVGDAVPRCASVNSYGFAEPDGTFTTSVRVSRLLGGLDCAARPSRCHLWAFPQESLDHVWAVPLRFDSASPATPPTVTVTPSTGLLHRQLVEVSGNGFAPGSGLRVEQCPQPMAPAGTGCTPLNYVSTGTSGGFTATVPARRMIGDRDCAVETCVIRVSGPPLDVVDVAVGFDASVPPPPPPTLTVTPSEDLVDRQQVSVTVTELETGSVASVATCLVGSVTVCRGAAQLPPAPLGGTVTAPMTVFRTMSDGTDCAPASCVVRVSMWTGSQSFLDAPITFDPDSPIADPPALRVLPATGLWDGQQVQLRGERFDAGSYLYARQCAGDPIDANCESYAQSVTPDPLGNIALVLAVRRHMTTPAGAQDCVAVTCSIVLSTGMGPPIHVTPITFDPDAPPVATDLPPQLECVSWPTGGWPTGDLPAGVDRAAVEALGEQMVGTYGGDSVVVIQGGRLVYENYAEGMGADTVFPSMSMSKSFTSTMVGLLVDDGLIDIDQDELFPEWSDPADPRSGITTRHLLNMSSGLQFDEIYGGDSDVIRMIQSADAAAYVVAKPSAHPPGTSFSYSTGDTMLLSRVIGDAAGVSGPTYEAMLQDRLFAPLGIDPVIAGFDEAGRWRAGWFTNTTTRNFAKLGLLYLRHGVWEDQQFLSEDWVDFVRTPAPTYSGYGGQFWLNGDGSFSMVGVGGQNVLIVPRLDLIVAVNNGGSAGSMANLFANAAPATCGPSDVALADDAASVAVDGSVLIDVLANDSGGAAGLAPITLTVSTEPSAGTATVESGRIRYTPDPGSTGSDTFDYFVCTTGRRPCLEATVTVAVGT